MRNIKALRQRRIILKSDLKIMLEAAKTEGRELTSDEEKKFDDVHSDLLKLDVEANEAERELEAERGGVAVDVREMYNDEGAFLSRTARSNKPGGGRKYAELFGRSVAADKRGFRSFDDFLSAVNGGMDSRLGILAATGANESVPSDGGFLVPTEFAAELLDTALESEIVRPRAKVYPMKSASKKIPGFDGLDHSGGTVFGGFAGTWFNEGTSVATLKKAKFRAVELIANKLGIFTVSSNELIADGADFVSTIGDAMIRAISWYLDNAFLNGDGAGKPQGVLNARSLIVVAKDSGQPAATITYSNVSAMFARLHPSFFADAVWVVNSSALPQLLQMQNVVKNVAGTENVGGSAVPIFSMDGSKFMMLGKEVLLTEKLPAVGTQGDILLASFSNYGIGIRKEATIEKSNAPHFSTDETDWRAILRVDGQDLWNKPFTPLHGVTQGWAITLATRS